MNQAQQSATILIVDDDEQNVEIVTSLLIPHGFLISAAYDGYAALEMVQQNPPDLILLDIRMPGLDGYEVCRRLKEADSTRLIPVVLLTSLTDTEDRIHGIDVGADDFLTKNFDEGMLVARVRSLIKMKRLNTQLLRAEQVILTLLNAIEAKDPYTQGHVVRVRVLSEAIGVAMGLSETDLNHLRIGAMLHDIGKIGLRDWLLRKPESLTEAEYEDEVRRHPVIGATILEPLRYPHDIMSMVRHHHERLDGSGYPDGLSGNQIPLLTRIISVADIYDALRYDRPYRKGAAPEQVLAYLLSLANDGKLDIAVVDALTRLDNDILAPMNQAMLLAQSLSIGDEEAALLLGPAETATAPNNESEI